MANATALVMVILILIGLGLPNHNWRIYNWNHSVCAQKASFLCLLNSRPSWFSSPSDDAISAYNECCGNEASSQSGGSSGSCQDDIALPGSELATVPENGLIPADGAGTAFLEWYQQNAIIPGVNSENGLLTRIVPFIVGETYLNNPNHDVWDDLLVSSVIGTTTVLGFYVAVPVAFSSTLTAGQIMLIEGALATGMYTVETLALQWATNGESDPVTIQGLVISFGGGALMGPLVRFAIKLPSGAVTSVWRFFRSNDELLKYAGRLGHQLSGLAHALDPSVISESSTARLLQRLMNEAFPRPSAAELGALKDLIDTAIAKGIGEGPAQAVELIDNVLSDCDSLCIQRFLPETLAPPLIIPENLLGSASGSTLEMILHEAVGCAEAVPQSLAVRFGKGILVWGKDGLRQLDPSKSLNEARLVKELFLARVEELSHMLDALSGASINPNSWYAIFLRETTGNVFNLEAKWLADLLERGYPFSELPREYYLSFRQYSGVRQPMIDWLVSRGYIPGYL